MQAEIESVIWEADTDCDRCLTWKEFQEMYDRCRNDQTGTFIGSHTLRSHHRDHNSHLQSLHDALQRGSPYRSLLTCTNLSHAGYEPRRLFNVVLFLMNDKDSKGTVSVEETMQILYLRYGRQLLDAQLEEIFGTSDLNSGKALTLSQFMHSLHTSQVRQLNSRVTAKTYQVPPPVPKKQVAS